MTYHKYPNVLFAVFFTMMLFGGCSNATHKSIPSSCSKPTKTHYLKKDHELVAYLNSIIKRITMFSLTPGLEHKFILTCQHDKFAVVQHDQDKHISITVSRAALEKFKDEAQLAAALSYLLVQCHQQDMPSEVKQTSAIDYDKTAMAYMAKAGYNPLAAIELQEIYVNSDHSYGWLADVLSYPVNEARIAASKAFLPGLSKGALRSEAIYRLNIGLHD